jgi:hypothetical protein
VSDNNPIVNVCGLWAAKQGSKLIASGRLGNVKVLVFRNENKQNDRSPDFNICITKWEERPPSGGTEQVTTRRRDPVDEPAPWET